MEIKPNQPQSLTDQLSAALENGELVVKKTPPEEETPVVEADPKEEELKARIDGIFEEVYQREDALSPTEASEKPKRVEVQASPEQEQRKKAFVAERLENFQKLVEQGERTEEQWKDTLDMVRRKAEFDFGEQEKKSPGEEGTRIPINTESKPVVIPHTVSWEEQERALSAVPQEERDHLGGMYLSELYKERDRLANSQLPENIARTSAIDVIIRHKTTKSSEQPAMEQKVVKRVTRAVPQKPVVEASTPVEIVPSASLSEESAEVVPPLVSEAPVVLSESEHFDLSEFDNQDLDSLDISAFLRRVHDEVPEEEKVIEKQIDTEVAQKFEEDFKLTQEDLKGLTAEVGEGAEQKTIKFENLTPGQQALLLDNLKAFALDNAKEEALRAHTQKERERYADAKGWSGVVKKAWYGVTKTYRRESELTSGVKEVLENTEGNKEQYTEVLKEMIAQVSEAPEVVQNADGTLEIKFATEKDLEGVRMEESVKKALEEYNITAGEFMKVRPEWAWSKNPEEQQKYETAKANYFSAQTTLEFAPDANGNRVSYEKLMSLDKRVRWSQLFNADPKIEEIFSDTKDATAWKEGLKAAMLERGKLFAMGNVSRSLAMALGTASAAVASGGILGVVGVGALGGSLSGGWIGREMAQKRAKLEIADNKKESEMKMTEKLEYAISRMQAAMGTEEEEKISKILADRIYYTEQKLENGLVTSDEKMGGVKSSYSLAFALAQARSLINTYATGSSRDIQVKEKETGNTTIKTVDMRDKINALLGGQAEKISAEEKKLLQQRMRQGMVLGAVFGGALGAALAEVGTLIHGGKAVEVATATNGGIPKGASDGYIPPEGAAPSPNTNLGLQENSFKNLEVHGKATPENFQPPRQVTSSPEVPHSPPTSSAHEEIIKNVSKNSGGVVPEGGIEKVRAQFTDLIHNTKPGEHDSIWRSVRDGILEKSENASKFGYHGDVKDTAALHKWAEGETAKLWKEYEVAHGGHGKDLVHEGDVVKVNIGEDGKAHLEVEYASGKSAGYLHESDVRTPHGGAQAGSEPTVSTRTEEFPGQNSPLKASTSKMINAGADTLAKETGISHEHAKEIILAGSTVALTGVGFMEGKKIFTESDKGKEFYEEKEIDRKNLTARSSWTKEMLEKTQKEGEGVGTKEEAEKFIREKIDLFFDELLRGVQQEKYWGGPSMTPDDQKVVLNSMGALYDGVQELRARFDISGENISENGRKLFETVEEARKSIKMTQVKFT